MTGSLTEKQEIVCMRVIALLAMNAETNRRLGMAVTPAMGIRVILVSPSEDSFEKGNQSLDFPHFSTSVHTL